MCGSVDQNELAILAEHVITHRLNASMSNPGNSVCAVVITFEPSVAEFSEVISSIKPQVGEIVVVDNYSSPAVLEQIKRQVSSSGAQMITFNENLGIAAGHNRGIQYARERGFKYVLFLDQDSVAADNMVEQLVFAHSETSAETPVSAVGPQFIPQDPAFRPYFVQFGAVWIKKVYCDLCAPIVKVEFLISSGTLMQLDALSDIGGMDESLFIDHVDTEWFLRASAKGYCAYGVRDAKMQHALGNRFIAAYGSARQIPLHTPLRHYYIIRNSVALMKKKYAPLKWQINNVYRIAAMFAFFLLFAPNRLQRARMMLTGFWHGARGRLGKFDG